MKDKARMQHRVSVPDFPDDTPVTTRTRRQGGRSTSGSDREDGHVPVSGRRKSAPNLFSAGDGSETEQKQPFTYEDLYQKQLLSHHHHHHHHGRRTRRMREYDSDTGYRSEQDFTRFQRQTSDDSRPGHSDTLSVRSQPTMSRSRRRHGREAGYASDLEAYAGMGRGSGRGVNSSSSSSLRPPIMPLFAAHSVPHDLNTQTMPISHNHSRANPMSGSQSWLSAPDSCRVNRPSSAPLEGPPQPAPSPTQLSSSKILDQSTPVTSQAPQAFPSPSQQRASGASSIYSQAGARADRELQRELFTVLEERNRKTFQPPTARVSPSPKLHGSTPPPYQPAPPYKRTPSTRSDQSDENPSIQASSRDSGSRGGYTGGNSFSNPEYTAVQFADRNGSSREGGGDERSGVYGCQYETVAIVHQPPDSQYVRSGQHQQQPHQQQRTNLYPYTSETRTHRGDSDGSDQLLGQDNSITSHSISSGSFPQYTVYNHPSSGASSHSDRVTDQSMDSLTTASRQLDLSGTVRRSPLHPADLSPRERSGSRGNVFSGRMNGGALTPQKTFEAYPNPYGEPLEAGDPLMMRYEDVAIFKVPQDPSSQVSSSTDSGYGHGHHIYERIGDLQMRRSGSPHSSTPPSHRETPVRHNSSSQGTPSRETTPVKEEGFYSVQGHVWSESSTQESLDVFRAVIRKNPGLGFSIAGGHGSRGNPYRDGDMGIFVTKVLQEGPAATVLQPGDKILQVNHIDFRSIDHTQAVNIMKTSSTVELLIERIQKVNLV